MALRMQYSLWDRNTVHYMAEERRERANLFRICLSCWDIHPHSLESPHDWITPPKISCFLTVLHRGLDFHMPFGTKSFEPQHRGRSPDPLHEGRNDLRRRTGWKMVTVPVFSPYSATVLINSLLLRQNTWENQLKGGKVWTHCFIDFRPEAAWSCWVCGVAARHDENMCQRRSAQLTSSGKLREWASNPYLRCSPWQSVFLPPRPTSQMLYCFSILLQASDKPLTLF